MTSLAQRPYHYWKFRAGVDCLARGDAPLRQRILWALTSYAGIVDRELPPTVREVYLELQAQVTWKQDGDPSEGTWAETLRVMSEDDARKVADLMVRLLELSIDPDWGD